MAVLVADAIRVVVVVTVPECVCVAVALLLSEVVPVLEALAPGVSEGVGEALTVVLPLTVEEGEGDGVPVPLCVDVPEGVPECVGGAVGVGDGVPVSLCVGDGEKLTVEEGVGGGVPVLLCVGELVADAVRVVVVVAVPESVCVDDDDARQIDSGKTYDVKTPLLLTPKGCDAEKGGTDARLELPRKSMFNKR